ARENGENPLLPRNCKRSERCDGHCLTVGRPSQKMSIASQETGLADVVRSILPRGRRLCRSAIPDGSAPFRRFWSFFCAQVSHSRRAPPSCAEQSPIQSVRSFPTQK